MVMQDTNKVVLDYSFKNKERDKIDTGLWKLIHRGKYVEESIVPQGFNLVCEGTKIEI